MIVIGDCRAFAQEFRIDAYTEILTGLAMRGLLQYRNHDALHRAGEQGAADDDHLVSGSDCELLADLLCYAANRAEVEAAVRLSRSAHAYHEDVTLCDRRGRIGARFQPPGGRRRGDQRIEPGLHDRALALSEKS